MRRPSARVVKTIGMTGGAGGMVAAALAAGWIGAALLIIAILAPIIAICWILADPDRPQRLALLVTTWRHGTTTPPRRATTTKPRHANNEPSATS
ncbi:hypothetical protein [Saccharothrix obliqua]|uniref:hypothetical protein n=1 Tax=Saccharothrix obliqua TaxID=2861747 RepID=UPI001C5D56D8|nr:hypothetical protein [Saccharothrix obliqua]MBW4716692.1 hypothetical protein [Saccharothrix obliqua]